MNKCQQARGQIGDMKLTCTEELLTLESESLLMSKVCLLGGFQRMVTVPVFSRIQTCLLSVRTCRRD
jgi:hypothetical protein